MSDEYTLQPIDPYEMMKIARAIENYNDLLKCAQILAGLEKDDRGRTFPTKEECAFAKSVLRRTEGPL